MKYLDIYNILFFISKTYGWKNKVKNSIAHDHEFLNWVVGWQQSGVPHSVPAVSDSVCLAIECHQPAVNYLSIWTRLGWDPWPRYYATNLGIIISQQTHISPVPQSRFSAETFPTSGALSPIISGSRISTSSPWWQIDNQQRKYYNDFSFISFMVKQWQWTIKVCKTI